MPAERGPSGTGHDTAGCPSCGLTLDGCGLDDCPLTAAEPVTEAAPAPWTADDWDDWVYLHANRNDVAESYATGLRVHGVDWPQWPELNAAILRRWSPAGLTYVKDRAWKIATQNL